MASNTAAWLTAEKAHPFEIKPAPLGTPGAGQILVKNHAVAINPIDGKLQKLAFYPMTYPTILGQDVAGEIAALGPDVTGFDVGDRVIGVTAGFATKQDTERAFQAYTILEARLTSKIPETISFERAVVIPLSVATAASGLFNPDLLALQLPTTPARHPTGETLLVWGGASSVGSSAIQLAVAAGYDVVTTASPSNFAYVTGLGASHVVDYNSGGVVDEVLAALDGKTLVGAFDAVGGAAWGPTAQVVHLHKTYRSSGDADGAPKKLVATVTPRFPEPPAGVTMKQMYALSIRDNAVAAAVWGDFLPKALREGTFVPAPEPLVAGHGLESIQAGVDLLGKGVSARKVVVTL
jgi:NADPH:quinone reductase-like Zn-dependent oxidoreductase